MSLFLLVIMELCDYVKIHGETAYNPGSMDEMVCCLLKFYENIVSLSS